MSTYLCIPKTLLDVFLRSLMMKPRPVVGFHVCALELQSIFEMAAKFTLKLPILSVNQHYYEQYHSIKNQKQSGSNILYSNIL